MSPAATDAATVSDAAAVTARYTVACWKCQDFA